MLLLFTYTGLCSIHATVYSELPLPDIFFPLMHPQSTFHLDVSFNHLFSSHFIVNFHILPVKYWKWTMCAFSPAAYKTKASLNEEEFGSYDKN